MNSCRYDKVIDDYLLGRLEEGEKSRFEEHFFNCRACFEELKSREEILRVIKERGGEIFAPLSTLTSGKALSAGRSAALRLKPWMALAALAVIAGLSLILFLPRRPSPSPVFTLGEDNTVRGEILELITPVGQTATAPGFFEWKPLSRSARYVLSLYGQELIWSGDSDDTRLALPVEIKQQMMPGRVYTWEVKAFTRQGSLISTSKRAEFRLAEE